MRGLLCTEFGRPDRLAVGDVPTPGAPGTGDVLIEVGAAGLNFADLLMIGGQYQEKPPLPFVPGLEIAGVVRSCGAGVMRVKPGDRVAAALDRGGFAEQVIAREADVFPIPEAMDLVTAAGFVIAYGTAHGALRWRADLQAGETLVVPGRAG